MQTANRTLVVISGPSGCGKDTVIKEVLKRLPGTALSVSCTTRARRKNNGEWETEGVDYYFIDQETFRRRIREGDFLEYAENKGELYGTPRAELEMLAAAGNDVILLNLENEGAAQIKAMDPTVTTVFLLPPDGKTLRSRLIGRASDTPEERLKRLEKGREQLRMAYMYDYVVMNDELSVAVQDVIHIICAVRRRTQLHKRLIDEVNASLAE